MTANAGHVFVSHSSDNRELATELAAFLESRGVRVWIAPRDVRPGGDYSEELQQAIESCVAFVVLVTDMANKSPYVRAETEMAFSTHKPIFPVRISDIQPASGLALFLKIRHWTDAYGARKADSLDRLTHELQALSSPAAPPETAPPPAPAAPAPAPSLPPSPPPERPPEPAPVPAMPVPPPPPLAPATPADEERWRAAIGPKADHYLERWRQIDAKGSPINWNWAACLANLFWFAYRKMWLPMIVFIVATVLLGIVGAASPALGKATLLLSIGLTFVTGSFGNWLYRKQISGLVAGTADLDQATAVDRLKSRGGVSVPALVISIAVVVLLTLIMVLAAAIAIQQQGDIDAGNRIDGTIGPLDSGGSVDPSQGISGETGGDAISGEIGGGSGEMNQGDKPPGGQP